MIILLFKLLCGHALADMALQTDFIATHKSPYSKSPQVIWPYVLTSHALIHGLMVMLATGSAALAMVETAAHWLIDLGKCRRKYGMHTDQALHFGCKLIYVAWMFR